jgi:LPS-assembly protein
LGNSFESGESITLGLNFKKEKINADNKIDKVEEYIDFKLASVFRLNEEKNIPTNSTLNKKNSNIFGQFNFKPIKNVSLGYNFSLTDDLNTFEYNSLITTMEFGNFVTQFNYLEERGVVGSTNTIENTTNYNFDDQNSISFNTRRNRKLDLTEYYDLIYEYKNDCLVAGIKYKKNYYNDADIKPVEELFFSITIVPLGTFSPSKMALK